MSWLPKTIGTVIFIVLPVYLAWYLGRSTPDVVYSLSEKISMPLRDSTRNVEEIYQHLIVSNVGDASATKIIGKISGTLIVKSFERHSLSDSAIQSNQSGMFQFEYPELPPNARVKIVFSSIGRGVNSDDVVVSHSGGSAREALSKAEPGRLAQIIPWLMLIVVASYFLLTMNLLRKSRLEILQSRLSSGHPIKLIEAVKPWYAGDSEWEKLRNSALQSNLEINRFADMSTQPAYLFLSIQSTTVSEEIIFKEHQREAKESLERSYKALVNSAWGPEIVIKLLRVRRPTHFPESDWNDLVKFANKQYLSLREKESAWGSKAQIHLSEEKPQEIDSETWNALRDFWIARYFGELCWGLELSQDPQRYAADARASLLDAETASKWDSKVRSRTRSTNIGRAFSQILANLPIDENKPDCVEEHEWRTITSTAEMKKRLDEVENEDARVRNDRKVLDSQRSEVERLRMKVTGQLDFIQGLLKDPSIIDRVEPYDDTFCEGNFANLKRVAFELKKSS